jgi:hypothetical protein
MLTVVSGYEYVAALATVASGLTVWRRSIKGRWPLKMIFVVFALFTVGMGTRFAVKRRTAQKREAAYQLALSEYQQVLKPGMTRKEVETYLHSKNINFNHTCCIESSETAKRHSWDDLVAIGQEDHPWFCSEHKVYIAFQFIDYKQENTGYSMEDDDLDSLRSISIHHSLEGCL